MPNRSMWLYFPRFRAPTATAGSHLSAPPRFCRSSSVTSTPRTKNPYSGLLEKNATPPSSRPNSRSRERELRVQPVVVVELRGDRIDAKPLARIADREVAGERRRPRDRNVDEPGAPIQRLRKLLLRAHGSRRDA